MTNENLTVEPKKQRITALAIISLSSFVSAFMGSAFSVAAPEMTNPTSSQYVPGLTEAGIGWVITVYILATAMLQIPFGKISDNYGRKKIYLIGTIIFSLATLVLGFIDVRSCMGMVFPPIYELLRVFNMERSAETRSWPGAVARPLSGAA